ncbi:MAG: Na+ dependent nucleoside transporter N-terminal domain-containing protein, partial [Pseudomonadales bacterium]
MDNPIAFWQALFGIGVFVLIGWLLSENRREFSWRVVAAGLGLQFVIALLMLKVPVVQDGLALLNRGVLAISDATEAGTGFVFGYLGADPEDVQYPFAVEDPGATFILAFRMLPLILFFTVLS